MNITADAARALAAANLTSSIESISSEITKSATAGDFSKVFPEVFNDETKAVLVAAGFTVEIKGSTSTLVSWPYIVTP